MATIDTGFALDRRATLEPVDPLTQLKIARELGSNMRELDDVLATHEISHAQFDELQKNVRFQKLLRGFVEEWNKVSNTPERVKLKALSFVEEALPEYYARAHDAKEPLSAKVELLKTVAKLGGIGGEVNAALAGEKMTITINLGADAQLQFDKTIDGTLANDDEGFVEDLDPSGEDADPETDDSGSTTFALHWRENDELGEGVVDEHY